MVLVSRVSTTTAFLLMLSFAVSAVAQTRAEIPIREVVQSNGQHRYTLPITLGGVQIEAAMDSGSTGLRVLPGVVPPAAERGTGRQTRYGYDNNVEFSGTVVEADLTIGLSGRARFQQIDKVGCKAGIATCQATTVKPEEFGIESGGLPNEGFKAIVGVNMANDAAPNPLVALGAKRWIIELPRPGEGKPGRLVLNPTDAEVAGYKLFRIESQFREARGGLHDSIEGCLMNQATKRSYCGPTDFDTGAPGVQIATSEKSEPWLSQTPASVAFYDNGKPVIGADFVVDRGPGAHVRYREPQRAPRPHIFLGILPYFAFSVLYDPGAGAVGLKAR